MADFIVTSNLDIIDPNDGVLTLREAFENAMSTPEADSIDFAPAVSTIRLNSELVLTSGQDITVNGDRDNNGRADVFISGEGASMHFVVLAGAKLRLVGVDLVNALSTTSLLANGDVAGSILNQGELVLERVEFANNIAIGAGGYAPPVNTSQGSLGTDGLPGAPLAPMGGDGGQGGLGPMGFEGGDGSDAAIVRNSGVLTLIDTGFAENNVVSGGAGGTGGQGGIGGTGGEGGSSFPDFQLLAGGYGGQGGPGGAGGTGGNGGNSFAILDPVGGAGGSLADATALYGGAAGPGGAAGMGGFPGLGGYSNALNNPAVAGNFGPGPVGFEGYAGIPGASASVSTNGYNFDATDSLVFLHMITPSVQEGENVQFSVNRVGSSQTAFNVEFEIDDRATDGTFGDLGLVNGSVSFTAGGPDTILVEVPTSDDDISEDTEGFMVRIIEISNETGGSIAGGSGAFGEIASHVEGQDNRPPVAVQDFFVTDQFVPLFSIDPRFNDFDPDGDPLTVLEPGLSAGGIALLNDDGTLSYAPRPDFVGSDFVNYEIQDPFGESSESFLEIVVEPLDERIVCARIVAYLYEVSLNRFPDVPGVNFWIDGVFGELPGQADPLTKEEIASFFLQSPEFEALFGNVDLLTDRELVELLFLNTLDRPGETAGVNFWVNTLSIDPDFSRADLLLAFAQSPENQLGSPDIVSLTEVSPSDWDFA